jgi:hypothetical protein
MGGPGASILLPAALNPAQVDKLMATLRAISKEVTVGDIGVDFWVVDTYPVGGDYKGEGQPFIFYASEPQLEADQLATVVTSCGCEVRQELGFTAMCGGEKNHRILGTLILWFAEAFGGLVDFDGAILPLNSGMKYFGSSWNEETESAFKGLTRDMPGKILSLPYETGDGIWVSHVADCEFLRAWLRHADFHMLK